MGQEEGCVLLDNTQACGKEPNFRKLSSGTGFPKGRVKGWESSLQSGLAQGHVLVW